MFSLAMLFSWVFVESFLLATVGSTPGKWLLRTRVFSAAGMKPSYSSALSRSFKVWWRGYGMGIPLASLITCLVAHEKLTKDGITSWDKDDGFIVVHDRIGAGRIIVAAVLFLGIIALMVAGIALDA